MMVPLSTRCESAFLHRDVEETDFVEQTRGYKRHGEEDKVYNLRKALRRAWYKRIMSCFQNLEETACQDSRLMKGRVY